MGGIIEEKEGNCLLRCRIQPSASKTAIAGIYDGSLKIALAAPPVDGKANKALCQYIAKLSGVPKSSVSVLKGEKGRSKTVLIVGIKAQKLKPILLNE